MMMRTAIATLLLLVGSWVQGQPVTIDNDSSCDIADLPAATLLLPYFEVDLHPSGDETTVFTVTNVTNLPQAVRVTLWTDLAYPVFNFSIYLTGYDVQSINLRDVLVHGLIAPETGTGSDRSPVGVLSGTSASVEFDNPLLDESSCVDPDYKLSSRVRTLLQQAFTTGTVQSSRACPVVGNRHGNAVGYATIDVVGSCNDTMPGDAGYFSDDIRFDNVLLGDYLQINGSDDFAQGDAMVHIRAIPEGGHPRDRLVDPALSAILRRTFYERFQPATRKGFDARQPLPSVFAARWIEGSGAGFETYFKIWREAFVPSGNCAFYVRNQLDVVELVRFDEDENPTTTVPVCVVTCIDRGPIFAATGLINAGDDEDYFPPNPDAAVGGWMYLNLVDPYGVGGGQAWVTVSMRAEDRFSVDLNAQALGNGCSPHIGQSEASSQGLPIGPLPNRNY